MPCDMHCESLSAVNQYFFDFIFIFCEHYNLTPAPFKNLASSSKAHLGFAG